MLWWYVIGGAVVAYIVVTLIGLRFTKSAEQQARGSAHFHPIGPEHRKREALRQGASDVYALEAAIERRMVIICHTCGAAEQVEELTDETVGVWGEKMQCSRCKEAAKNG